MKKISIVLAAIFCGFLSAADYAALTKEAKAAAKEKNYEVAMQKYAEAYNAAAPGRQKLAATKNYGKFLASRKQKDKAAELYENELKNGKYSPGQQQGLLVDIAAMYLWDAKKYQYALDKLNLAFAIKGGVAQDAILYYVMCHYAACIYSTFKKEYDPIIVLCEPAAERSKVNWHKATLYNSVASAYMKLNKKEEAIKNYELALHYGKLDKRYPKKSIEAIEKILERLKK